MLFDAGVNAPAPAPPKDEVRIMHGLQGPDKTVWEDGSASYLPHKGQATRPDDPPGTWAWPQPFGTPVTKLVRVPRVVLTAPSPPPSIYLEAPETQPTSPAPPAEPAEVSKQDYDDRRVTAYKRDFEIASGVAFIATMAAIALGLRARAYKRALVLHEELAMEREGRR